MYKDISIPEAMDRLHELQRISNSTEAADKIAAEASLMPRDVALIALARLYVVSATQARYGAARLASMESGAEGQVKRVA